MIATLRARQRLTRTLAAAGGATLLLIGAAACGSAGPATTANGPSAEGGQQGGPRNQQAGSVPGAVGKVAAVADHTAQVQGMQGQVAVSWTTATKFTQEVPASLSDVKVGTCVLVLPSDQGTGAGSSGSGVPTAVTASGVRISEPTDGTCNPVRGPGGAGGPQLQGTPPSGAPQGGPRPQVRGLGGAMGKVTAVSASGFTVSSVMPGSTAATTVTVTVGAATTYTTTATGAPTDVKVGVCVQAQGAADDTGAVTATRIAVSTPQDGQCGGFMRMRSGDGQTNGRANGQES
jgi:hypothetical protein